MNLTKNIIKTTIPAIAALIIVGGGCKSKPVETTDRDAMEFYKACEVSPVTALANTQIAVGARTDATLRPYHFNDAGLNSLGREKVDFMIRETGDDSTGKLVVYVDLPKGEGDADKDLVKARQDAVSAYLVNAGRSQDSFRLEAGFNPNDTIAVTSAKPAATDGAAAGSEAAGSAEGFAPAASAK